MKEVESCHGDVWKRDETAREEKYLVGSIFRTENFWGEAGAAFDLI